MAAETQFPAFGSEKCRIADKTLFGRLTALPECFTGVLTAGARGRDSPRSALRD
jgi:hypothetical protein